MQVKAILISGTMGSGKTTVLAEASDILLSKGIVHAAIDLDTLGIAHLPNGVADDLLFRNLASVWANYQAAGVTRLLLAEALETAADLERTRNAIGEVEIVVCRLTASEETAKQRVRTREPGMLQETFVTRVADLGRILDLAALENFSIQNDNASVTDVARELLLRAGWLECAPPSS
jgi:adenylylsulfate kinase